MKHLTSIFTLAAASGLAGCAATANPSAEIIVRSFQFLQLVLEKFMFKIKTTLVAAVTVASLVQPAAAALFGPSTDILQGPALAQMLQSQPMVLTVSGGQLDVRSKAAAVGGFLLGFVASSAMASGGMRPGMNAQQMNQTMQANLQIATAFNQNIQSTVTRMAADQAAKTTT